MATLEISVFNDSYRSVGIAFDVVGNYAVVTAGINIGVEVNLRKFRSLVVIVDDGKDNNYCSIG